MELFNHSVMEKLPPTVWLISPTCSLPLSFCLIRLLSVMANCCHSRVFFFFFKKPRSGEALACAEGAAVTFSEAGMEQIASSLNRRDESTHAYLDVKQICGCIFNKVKVSGDTSFIGSVTGHGRDWLWGIPGPFICFSSLPTSATLGRQANCFVSYWSLVPLCRRLKCFTEDPSTWNNRQLLLSGEIYFWTRNSSDAALHWNVFTHFHCVDAFFWAVTRCLILCRVIWKLLYFHSTLGYISTRGFSPCSLRLVLAAGR